MLRKLIREPLIHFLGGALLVFIFFWATGTGRDPENYTINIEEADIARLKAGWTQNFRRVPTQDELDGLIDQEIAEEIYYREALRLGLDQDDPVIRRRLFTKMRFIDDEDTRNTVPTDPMLQEWMDKHPDRYTLSPIYAFEQIYLGQIDMAEAERRIAQLNKGAEPTRFAQPISLPATLKRANNADISRNFGDRFAEQLADLKTNIWSGPITSGFGVHAVKLTAKTPGRKASLNNVRRQVVNDWRADQKAREREEALSRYKAQYEITVADQP
ncbi:peptidylprolyl isomerase [Parasphingorhabdus sp.]|uniref:peptidylprolyl isomerase n=1 Tax=Parasphingorhabdus sp. TaxID=2709688 RepID=UPI003266D497